MLGPAEPLFDVGSTAEEEYWCHKPEGLLHGRRSVQYLSIVIGAAFGGRCKTVSLHGRHLLFVKLVVEKALEAGARWCSGKPKADATAAYACRACCGVTTGTCWPLVDGRIVFLGLCTSA